MSLDYKLLVWRNIIATSDYSTVVQQLYVAYFDRPADVLGLSNFENALNAAGAPATIAGLSAAYSTDRSVKTLVDSFGNSSESLTLYGTGSTASFVNAIYTNVLGRSADVGGLLFWANAIDSGVLTKGAASLAIMAGALVNTSEQGLIDAAVLANKVTVAANFTSAMDTTEKLLAYDGDMAAATARSMLATVTSTTDTTAFQTMVTSTLSNLITSYNTGAVFTLTTASDTFIGTAKDNTFNALGTTFTNFDQMDGGAGNDVLNITSTAAFTVPLAVSVTNIETVNFNGASSVLMDTSSGWTGLTALNVTNAGGADTVTTTSTTAISITNSAQAANAIKVDGGSTVTVTATGAQAGGDITVVSTDATGAVTVSSTAQAMTSNTTGGAIAVTGGTTISITSTTEGVGLSGGEIAIQGDISVTGNANTTTVSIIQSGNVNASPAVAAVANTNNAVAAVKGNSVGQVHINAAAMTAVILQNYGDSSISSNQLAILTLSGTGVDTAGEANTIGTLNLIDNSTTPTVTELTLNLGGGSLGAITDTADKFTTVNVVMTANTKLDSIADTALRTLAISGTGVLSLSNVNPDLTSITVADAAGFKGDFSNVSGITSFTAENTTADNTVTLNATTQTYTGGSGNDKVIISEDATTTITGGDGIDTLVLNAAGDTFTEENTGTNVTGFEVLVAGNSASGTVDVSALGGSAFTKLQASASVTFSNVTAGTVLELVNSGLDVNYQTSDTDGANDTVTVMLDGATASTGTGTKGYTTTSLSLRDSSSSGISGIGSVNIVTDASVIGGVHTISTLTDDALQSLAINGTGALAITNLNIASVTSFTLSDNTTSTVSSTIGTFTANYVTDFSYSGTHGFGITTLLNSVADLTITNANTGSTGVLTIGAFTVSSSTTSLTLNGAVSIITGTLSSGTLNVSGATDDQNVSLTGSINNNGVKTITLGNGDNTITTGTGKDVITLGSGANTVTGGAGGDKITFAAHTGVDMVKYTATGQTATGAVISGTTALTIDNGYDIYTGLQARDKIDLTGLITAAQLDAMGGYNAAATAISTSIITAGINGDIAIVRGNYAASTGIFTTSSTGTDSIVQWDSNGASSGGNVETIVLVGFVNSASSATAAGVITLA